MVSAMDHLDGRLPGNDSATERSLTLLSRYQVSAARASPSGHYYACVKAMFDQKCKPPTIIFPCARAL
jgi:hypothetical protein